MGIIRRLFEGAAMIGWGNILPLAAYTGRKKRLDRAYLAGRRFPDGEPFPWLWQPPEAGTGPWREPGPVGRVETTDRGLEAFFSPGAMGDSRKPLTLRLTFLAPDLLEVTWGEPLPGQPIPGQEAGPGRPGSGTGPAAGSRPEVAVRVERGDLGWILRTSDLDVLFAPDGSLAIRDTGGGLIREEAPPLFAGDAICHRVLLSPGERVHGLGERAAPLDLRGGAYRLWNRDPGGAYGPGEDPLYLCVPIYLIRPAASGRPAGAQATSTGGDPGYMAFYANAHPGFIDVGRADPAILEHRFAGGGLRYYLALGPAPRAIARLSGLWGRPPLPPLWALGYHQCRWSYYPEARVRKLAADFVEHGIPVDSIHLDIHYMDGYRVFTVDKGRFPDLGTLAADLASQGIRLVAVVDPGIKADRSYRVFREGQEKGMFTLLPDGRTVIAPVWPGPAAFPDFSRPEVREWWGRQFGPLLESGISGFWQDMNEPAAFVSGGDGTLPLGARHAAGDHFAVHNLYGLWMTQATDEGLRRLDPGRRPFLITRSGWAGVCRHAWTWTADVRSDWDSLRQTVAAVVGLGLSGIPYSGSDVGGFNGRTSGELYTRWLQMSAFMPFFRSHTMIGTPDQEPWSFGEPYTAVAREFIRLRYALLPYFYTLARETAETGWPMVRPLFWGHGDKPRSGGDSAGDDQFLLGDSLLVAPVVTAGASSRDVTVPAGLWYDFWTDRPVKGPDRPNLEAPLGRIPLLVRAGTVLPLEDPVRASTSQRPEGLCLHVYPPAEDGAGGGSAWTTAGSPPESRLYTDAGDGHDPGRVDCFRLERIGKSLRVVWEAPRPSWETPSRPEDGPEMAAWPYARTEVVLHGANCRRAVVNGATVPVSGNRFGVTPQAEIVVDLD